MSENNKLIEQNIKEQALNLYRRNGVGCSNRCIAYDDCKVHKVHYRRCQGTIYQKLLRLRESSKKVHEIVSKDLKKAGIIL